MQQKWLKRAGWLLILGSGIAAIAWFAWPRPIPVDLAIANAMPMEVTIDDEARTRVRHVYTVSAPVAGKVLRISHPAEHEEASLHVGDEVTAEETVVAVLQPMAPGFLDIRSRQELEAAVAAANAAVTLAEAEVRRIEAALEFSRSDLQRAQSLAGSSTISVKALDQARLAVETNEAALASTRAQLDVRRGEQAIAAARLIEPSDAAEPANRTCCIQVRAPVDGRVLKIIQQDEAAVPAGAPLIEIGDPTDLEVVADLLSTEAVRIKPGAAVSIEGWGGPPIKGSVRRVEPAGFVKVSALGIEEQRVTTIIDFAEPLEAWSQLGHDFRVIVRVTAWETPGTLTVPVSALFRKNDDWAVFAVADGQAKTTVIQTGQRNSKFVEVLSGLSEGDQVILHPSDRIMDGAAVSPRDSR